VSGATRHGGAGRRRKGPWAHRRDPPGSRPLVTPAALFATAVLVLAGSLDAALPSPGPTPRQAAPQDSATPPPDTAAPATPSPGSVADRRDAELDALTAEVAGRFRCLVCRGQSVAESSSQLAREMQREIRERLGHGETPEHIEAFFVDSYGEWILLRPPARGVNLLVYLLPAAAFVVGLAIVGWVVRARRPSEPIPESSPAPDLPDDALDPEDRAWLERAIRGDR